MGVPITFLDKYNPDQFEIIGISKTWFGGASKTYGMQIQIDGNGKRTMVSKLNDGPALKIDTVPAGTKTFYEVDGKRFIQTYARVFIKRRGGKT